MSNPQYIYLGDKQKQVSKQKINYETTIIAFDYILVVIHYRKIFHCMKYLYDISNE